MLASVVKPSSGSERRNTVACPLGIRLFAEDNNANIGALRTLAVFGVSYLRPLRYRILDRRQNRRTARE